MRPFSKSVLLWAFAPAILLAIYGGYLSISSRPQKRLPEEMVVVTDGAGTRHSINVEMAVTPQEREKGLMFRRALGANAGMLFIFPKVQVVDFWMKDTILSLDMIFIRKDGTIDSIARNEAPFSLANTLSAGPVVAALEVPAGTAMRLGLQRGDKVMPLPSDRPSS